LGFSLQAQITVLKGEIKDSKTGEVLIGASVLVKGTSEAIATDYDGNFELKTKQPLPVTLVVSYIGYTAQSIVVSNSRDRIKVALAEEANVLNEVTVIERGKSEKEKEKPISTITLGQGAIKEAVSGFYNTLGNQAGVDLTTASLGFTVINTRGFNSTSPVRSLQIIDGVDNQAPGLNFSLGNFLGASELDVNKVELIVGASSAFYGPNAFNGVVAMDTKKPFYSKGFSASVKSGERNLLEVAARYADVVKNKNGKDMLGFKFNLFHFRANDWTAENYDPVTGTDTGRDNPGRYDAVNIYGDEYNVSGDNTTASKTEKIGLGNFHRTGYKEIDLVDYNTRNYKANAAVYLRLNPEKGEESAELNYGFNYGNGTTVYQGDNRFSLKNISFLQHKLELKKGDKYFVRAYTTMDNAGDSYDPYATALRLQDESKQSGKWYSDYTDYWRVNFDGKAIATGYPQFTIAKDKNGDPIVQKDPITGKDIVDPITGLPKYITSFDEAAAARWLIDNKSTIVGWHKTAADEVNKKSTSGSIDYAASLEPGSEAYKAAFKRITSTPANQKDVAGTKFVDRSALYHVHGERKFEPVFTDEIVIGANYRLYTPISDGTIFYDTADIKITNSEYGFYAGFKKKLQNGRFTINGTMRIDKNQNFGFLPSPAASMVWNPKKNTYFRFSFSSAIRNPTLSDQYLNLNVGRAILSGNLDGRKNMITVPSFIDYLASGYIKPLVRFDIAGVRPENVRTGEVGVRTTIGTKCFIDAGYYFSAYKNFIGYNIAISADTSGDKILKNIQAYRFATNSLKTVTTQGLAIGVDYYQSEKFSYNANYSWNKLIKTDADDPIIPAFNTPEHKFNVGLTGRKLKIKEKDNNEFGFRINYKWVQGFTFDGSPQFSGDIPSYGLLDVQVNYSIDKQNTVIKVGASNVLRNLHYEVYGGPLVGRLGYISLLYNFQKK
jgi:outer membrane receptor protein involved in Fe transport